MRVVVTDLLTGTCELTGRSEVEVVRVQLEENSSEVAMIPAELIKQLRLKKRQETVGSSNSQEKKGAMP
jgi:hypothetical protein